MEKNKDKANKDNSNSSNSFGSIKHGAAGRSMSVTFVLRNAD